MVTDAARRRRKHGSTGYRGCESRALPHGVFGSFLTSTGDQKQMGGIKGIGLCRPKKLLEKERFVSIVEDFFSN
jgi:hypothetical protein